MSTEPEEHVSPQQSGAAPSAVAEPAPPVAQQEIPVVPPGQKSPDKPKMSFIKKIALSTLGVAVVSSIVGGVVAEFAQPEIQALSSHLYGASPAPAPVPSHAFTITVSYGSPIQTGWSMALPASADGGLPSSLPDWSDASPGPVTQGILTRGPAEIGQNTFLVTLQNPAGQDSVAIDRVTAKILRTSAPYSGALFDFPGQGAGPNPKAAIDLDSPDLDARTWNDGNDTLGQNYFLGNYVDVSGGDSQSVEVVAFARQAAYEYTVQVTLTQDGRTWTQTLTADDHGTPFRATGVASSYAEVYADKNLSAGLSGRLTLSPTPWTPCNAGSAGASCTPTEDLNPINQ